MTVSLPTLDVVHERAKPVLCGPNSTEPNLYHHGETTYSVGWLSEYATGMLFRIDLWRRCHAILLPSLPRNVTWLVHAAPKSNNYIQRSAIRRAIGCVISPPGLLWPRGRVHPTLAYLIAELCNANMLEIPWSIGWKTMIWKLKQTEEMFALVKCFKF